MRIPLRASTLITHHAHYGSNDVNAAHLLWGPHTKHAPKNFNAPKHFDFFFANNLAHSSCLFYFDHYLHQPMDLLGTQPFSSLAVFVSSYNLKSSLIIFVNSCTYFVSLPRHTICVLCFLSLSHFVFVFPSLLYLDLLLLLTISWTDRGRGIIIRGNSINLIRKSTSNTIATTAPLLGVQHATRTTSFSIAPLGETNPSYQYQ